MVYIHPMGKVPQFFFFIRQFVFKKPHQKFMDAHVYMAASRQQWFLLYWTTAAKRLHGPHDLLIPRDDQLIRCLLGQPHMPWGLELTWYEISRRQEHSRIIRSFPCTIFANCVLRWGIHTEGFPVLCRITRSLLVPLLLWGFCSDILSSRWSYSESFMVDDHQHLSLHLLIIFSQLTRNLQTSILNQLKPHYIYPIHPV